MIPAGSRPGGISAPPGVPAMPAKTWIFDGKAIVPVLRTRGMEESIGTRPFASLGESLKANPGLNDSRAVLFEVSSSK